MGGGTEERTEHILVWMVEDSPTDAFVMEEALRGSGLSYELRLMRDGEAALSCIKEIDSNADSVVPGIVLLDLNLPKVPGLQILAAVRRSARLANVPVVVVSSSDFRGDIDAAAAHGATAYFKKPHDLDEFLQLGKVVARVLPPSNQ